MNYYFNIEYIDQEDETYYLLFLEYYYQTESYDRKICSNINGYGEAIPITDYERKLIYFNAKMLYDKLLKHLSMTDRCHYYRNYFCRLHFDRLKEEYIENESKIKRLLNRMKGCD